MNFNYFLDAFWVEIEIKWKISISRWVLRRSTNPLWSTIFVRLVSLFKIRIFSSFLIYIWVDFSSTPEKSGYWKGDQSGWGVSILNLIFFFFIETNTCMWQNNEFYKVFTMCNWKMSWGEKNFECIMKLTRILWIYVGLFQHTEKHQKMIELSRWSGRRWRIWNE